MYWDVNSENFTKVLHSIQMKIIVKDISPEFVFIFANIQRVNILGLKGLRQTNEGYTLESRENTELWYAWARYLETGKTIDDYFGVNSILAVKDKYQRKFRIKRSDILKSGRKELSRTILVHQKYIFWYHFGLALINCWYQYG